MDCTINESRFAHYAIGSYYYGSNDVFPGPRINNEKGDAIGGFDAREVTLWIRVRDFNQIFYFPCTCRNLAKYLIHSYLIFLTIGIFPMQK